MMKDPRTVLFLLTAIVLVAMWKSGRLQKVLESAFGK